MLCNHLSTLSKELCWSFRCAVWSVCISETGECHLFGERLWYSWKQEKNMVLLCGVMPSWPSCNHYAPRFMSRPAEALSSSGIRLKCLNTQKTVFCIIQCSVSNHSIWNSSSFIYCSVWIFGLHWFMQHAPDSLWKRFCRKTAAAGIQCVCAGPFSLCSPDGLSPTLAIVWTSHGIHHQMLTSVSTNPISDLIFLKNPLYANLLHWSDQAS